ncbi:hypothetical protein, partial [Polaromonas sp. CG_9.11]|uniref:hypothetical protein n=1 Tax=Polaromonas sp. CG_9.11 TaxID=2787730 RepID=UPI001E379065
FTSMPFKASTAQDNDALPACAHLPPRSGLVQLILSGVEVLGNRPHLALRAGSAGANFEVA